MIWGGVIQMDMGSGTMTWTVKEATKAIGVYPDCMHELKAWLLWGKRVFVYAPLDPFPKRFTKTLLSADTTIGRRGAEPVPFAACVAVDTPPSLIGIPDVVRRNTFWVAEAGAVDPISSARPLDLPPRAYGLSVSAQQAFFLTRRSVLAARIGCLLHLTGDDPENPLISGRTMEAGYELFLHHRITAVETLDRSHIPVRL